MAYRKSNGKLGRRKKIEPAVTTFYFNTEQVDQNTSQAFYVDLSQVASLANRRFYRQGINWMVGSIKIFTGTSGTVTCMKLPETWVMRNAYTKAFNAWMDMNDKALEDAESVRPKFMDFKIFADKEHHQKGFEANLLPQTFEMDPAEPLGLRTLVAAPGEWEASKIVVPTSITGGTVNSFELLATGASYPGVSPVTSKNAVSLIEGYAASRGLPYTDDPNTPLDANDVGPTGTPENWMSAMDNEGTGQTSAVIADNTTENDQAPYPFENDGVHSDTMYPGGANQLRGLQIHDLVSISATTVGSTSYMKGGEFACGLMKFIHTPTGTSANLGIQIDLIPGPHRGYLCEKMGA